MDSVVRSDDTGSVAQYSNADSAGCSFDEGSAETVSTAESTHGLSDAGSTLGSIHTDSAGICSDSHAAPWPTTTFPGHQMSTVPYGPNQFHCRTDI